MLEFYLMHIYFKMKCIKYLQLNPQSFTIQNDLNSPFKIINKEQECMYTDGTGANKSTLK